MEETMSNVLTDVAADVPHNVIQQFINDGAAGSSMRSNMLFGAVVACVGYTLYQVGGRYLNKDSEESEE